MSNNVALKFTGKSALKTQKGFSFKPLFRNAAEAFVFKKFNNSCHEELDIRSVEKAFRPSHLPEKVKVSFAGGKESDVIKSSRMTSSKSQRHNCKIIQPLLEKQKLEKQKLEKQNTTIDELAYLSYDLPTNSSTNSTTNSSTSLSANSSADLLEDSWRDLSPWEN
tara:strand:- start:139 stop:633 length:495 start_codon:yes stop_codon:yes gene_type:complete